MGKKESRELCPESWIFKMREQAEVKDVSHLSPYFKKNPKRRKTR